MDDEDRFSASSPESERDNDREEIVQDEPENDNDADADQDNNDEDEDDENNEDDDDDGDQEDGGDATQKGDTGKAKRSKSSTPALHMPWRPTVRPEAVTAKLYDIVPTMAAPQSTSINAMSMTPDLRYWFTGGSDGYIRKYDGPGSINGKMALTVAQRHPFVDSVTKAIILMSYWENEEPGMNEQVLSPVYSLAVESKALWLLSGLESGAINLQSVRHDEGKKICSLQQHTNAVSVLTMAPDEKTVLSGSWDKTILDWDLNTGQSIRGYEGTAGQISSVELRPAVGDPIPADIDEQPMSDTIATNNAAPLTNGNLSAINGDSGKQQESAGDFGEENEGGASPAHESLFGGSDAGSLFGETAGEQPFGQDDDFGTGMDMGQEGGMDHSADMAMAGMDEVPKVEEEAKPEQDSADKPADSKHATESQSQPAEPKPESSSGAGPDAMDVDDAPQGMEGAVKTEEEKAATQTDPSESQLPATEGESSTQPNTQQTETLPNTEQPTQTGSPMIITEEAPKPQHDMSQVSATTFMSSAMDGTIRIWDKRVPSAIARISPRSGVPPWCMSACWSPDGNNIYAGRRNGTVEEYDIRKAKRGWEPERTFKFPAGSGAVSAVKPMVNGRHLVW